MDTLSGRLALALCAGALLTAGCSSDDSGAASADSGAPGVGEDASTGGSTPDATVPSDAGNVADAPVGIDAPTLTDSAPPEDGGGKHHDAAPPAEAGPDAADDAGPSGALPAAIAIWEFQDTPGSATAVDSSGNGHDATLMGTAAIVAGTGTAVDAGSGDDASSDASAADDAAADASAGDAGSPSTGAGLAGNYLQIDGTTGAFADVTGGPLFDDSQSFTVSAWVAFPSFNYNYDELISADGAHVSVFEIQLAPLTEPDGGSGYFSEVAFPTQDVPTPGAFYYGFSSSPPVTAAWQHIVGVYDFTSAPGLISLYVNGVLQSNAGDSRSTGASPVTAVGDFIIGAGKYNDARTNGAVANYMGVRVYGSALTSAQIATLYGMTGR